METALSSYFRLHDVDGSIPNAGVLPSFEQIYTALDFLSRPRLVSVGALKYVRSGKQSRIREKRPRRFASRSLNDLPPRLLIHDESSAAWFRNRHLALFRNRHLAFLPNFGRNSMLLPHWSDSAPFAQRFSRKLIERASCFGANWSSRGCFTGYGR